MRIEESEYIIYNIGKGMHGNGLNHQSVIYYYVR